MVVGASNGRCFFPRTSAGFLESAHRGGGEVNRTCGVYHGVVHSLIRLAFPMIVSFRDGWLRAFFVEDRRSRNIPSDPGSAAVSGEATNVYLDDHGYR